MTDTHHPRLDAQIVPEDQRRAAELAEAFVNGDGDRVGDLLTELLDAGAERTLATTAVQSRNLAAALVAGYGKAGALRALESTRLDAALAEPDGVED